MIRGPRLNDNSMNFTTRDNLGIEGVALSISGEICPVVTTVTPRAFYWPFMVWIYYDFFMYSGINEKTAKEFNRYVKRQDYFFVLACLLTLGSDQNNLVGRTQASIDVQGKGPYPYNSKYFQSRYGGMLYYNSGCQALGYVVEENPETGKLYEVPRLTKKGEEMALAFETVIKNTTYYREYRLGDAPVPRAVLEEYGSVINLAMKGFDRCKELLAHDLFHTKRNQKLSESANYILYLKDRYGIRSLSTEECRCVVYDHITPKGEAITLPEELETIGKEWEIVVGRQYFTVGLSMIWSRMLEVLSRPMSCREWMQDVIRTSSFEWDSNMALNEIIDCFDDSFTQREKLVKNTTSRFGNREKSVGDGIKLILAVYSRFAHRTDLGEDVKYLHYGMANHSVPLTELFSVVEQYQNRSFLEFIAYVMEHWLIEQHYITAFEKMLQKRNGFFYEVVDGKYFKRCDAGVDFQGLRLTRLTQVLKDLDML